ncbi:MAG: hypothetical protein R2753_11025 [Chitinophagales bacterium]
MKYKVAIQKITTVNEIKGYWTSKDYIELLKRLEFGDADQVAENELEEMLFMAISDYELDEAAAIVLTYKLGNQLTAGQIEQLSHEMITDKVAEEYADIQLQSYLFHINQLLFRAYNGKFPNIKASIIGFELTPLKENGKPITKEIVLKAFSNGLTDRSLLMRLLDDQLLGKAPFPEAEGIIWELKNLGEHQYQLITLDYWLNEEDFDSMEFEGNVVAFIEKEED